MNQEYEKRVNEAYWIDDLFRKDGKAVVLTGSNAYNPNSVTSQSDLDITVITDLSRLNHKDISKKLHISYDNIAEKCVKQRRANVIVIRWEKEFEIGLNLYDEK